MMDPNDPRYSDTPNVDTHPLEGRGKRPSPLLRIDSAERETIAAIMAGPNPMPRVELLTALVPLSEAISQALAAAEPADGYLLVSEAELAEAMDVADPSIDDHEDEDHAEHLAYAKDIFDALAKQQEGRER